MLIAVVGCRLSRVPESPVGRYTADYDQATESLDILKSNQFKQVVHLKTNGRTINSSGTWEFDPDSGNVIFQKGFILLIDGFRRVRPNFDSPVDGNVVYPVRWSPFGTYIGSDEGVLYRKQ